MADRGAGFAVGHFDRFEDARVETPFSVPSANRRPRVGDSFPMTPSRQREGS